MDTDLVRRSLGAASTWARHSVFSVYTSGKDKQRGGKVFFGLKAPATILLFCIYRLVYRSVEVILRVHAEVNLPDAFETGHIGMIGKCQMQLTKASAPTGATKNRLAAPYLHVETPPGDLRPVCCTLGARKSGSLVAPHARGSMK